MKKQLRIVLIAVLFVSGMAIMLYPAVSNFLHERAAVNLIDGYREAVANMNEAEIEAERERANAYNRRLAAGVIEGYVLESVAAYKDLLSFNEHAMAYITIPVADIRLPIRHGDSEETLRTSAGHIETSSLPVGGENTHALITAHRGLPSAMLFTNIDKLREGDLFFIHVLDETLAYKVDQIKTVLPEETDDLKIVPGMDYVTLITCTPYGINTHRLLIRGVRTEYVEQDEETSVRTEEVQQRWLGQAYIIGAGIALIIIMFLLFRLRRRKQSR